MPVHIAFLRGINVGGKNKLPMKLLAAIFVDAGCADVQTYIQSGNVIFTAAPALAKRLPAAISKRMAAKFKLNVPVMVRSAAELQRIVADNPFAKRGDNESNLHVMFLNDQPARQAAAALDASRSPGDSFILHGREIYLHLPSGVARSKLTNAWFDKSLATVSTARNWRTVLKLMALAHQS